MKAAEIRDGQIVLTQLPIPTLKDKGAIVKILGCGLCGSDIVKLKHNLAKEGTVLGHEIVGKIVEINSDTDFQKDDKIISSHHIPCFECDFCKNGNHSMCKHFKETNIIPGGFSEYIFLSDEHLKNVAYKIPKNLTEEEVSFYEPLGCCLRAVRRGCDDYNGKKVLVVGLGSIGMLMAQGLKAYNAEVFACDIVDERIKLAQKYGINSIHSNKTFDLNADLVFLTAGSDATIDLAIKAVRDGGKIVVFASTPKNMGFANNEVYYRELTVMGSYSPTPEDLKNSIDLLATKKVKVNGLSTIYKLDDIQKAFRDTIDNKILKAYIQIG